MIPTEQQVSPSKNCLIISYFFNGPDADVTMMDFIASSNVNPNLNLLTINSYHERSDYSTR